MYCLTVLLLIFGGTSSLTLSPSFTIEENLYSTLDVTYDCLDLKEKDLTIEIWSSTFPDNVLSLTIRNCENLVLNISTGERSKPSFQHLTVRNVKNCEITGAGFSGTALPSFTTFADVRNMKVEVPLYGETKFIEGVLQFTNVTITRLKPGAIEIVASSLRKFSLHKVIVIVAERDAIVFHGSLHSHLEIEYSTFYFVYGNFITCNVTSAVIRNNTFVVMKKGSFSLETSAFNSLGNFAFVAEDCSVKLNSRDKQIQNNACGCLEADSFKRNICVVPVMENIEEIEETNLYSEENDLDEDSNEMQQKIHIGCNGNANNYGLITDETEGGEKVSAFVRRFSNRFLLLWFLAISLLVLMFPIAYFTKIFLCRIVDAVYPLDMKHKRLVNAEDF